MTRIISSLGVIAFTGAVLAVGVTGAFFTDTETSVGNVFTAGSLAIQLDSAGFVHNANPIYGLDEAGNNSGWNAGDPYHQFLYFEDVIPGDSGARHLSLHNNSPFEDAYLCLFSGETSASSALGDEIEVFVWREPTQNFKYNPSAIGALTETALTAIPVSINDLTGVTYAEAGSVIAPLTAGATEHIIIAWCAGTMTVNLTGDASLYPGEVGSTIECDGASMTTQSESYVADMTIYGEQTAGNDGFLCSSVSL